MIDQAGFERSNLDKPLSKPAEYAPIPAKRRSQPEDFLQIAATGCKPELSAAITMLDLTIEILEAMPLCITFNTRSITFHASINHPVLAGAPLLKATRAVITRREAWSQLEIHGTYSEFFLRLVFL